MNLQVAVEVYYKLAQTLPPPQEGAPAIAPLTTNEQTLYKNHIIKINQQSQLLVTAVEAAITQNLLVPEARNHAMSLRNLAVRLTGWIMNSNPQQPQPSLQEFKTLYNNLAGEYSTLRNNYIQWDQPSLHDTFDPIMKSIQNSLVYTDRYLKKMEGIQSKLPNIG